MDFLRADPQNRSRRLSGEAGPCAVSALLELSADSPSSRFLAPRPASPEIRSLGLCGSALTPERLFATATRTRLTFAAISLTGVGLLWVNQLACAPDRLMFLTGLAVGPPFISIGVMGFLSPAIFTNRAGKCPAWLQITALVVGSLSLGVSALLIFHVYAGDRPVA